MATFFKTKTIKDVGILPISVLSPPSGTDITVIGLNLTNLTEFTVYTNVIVKDDTSVEVYYVKDVAIPPNSSLRTVTSGEKLVIPEFYELLVSSDETESLDAVVSYVEIV